jgi:homoserine trans-succinylase
MRLIEVDHLRFLYGKRRYSQVIQNCQILSTIFVPNKVKVENQLLKFSSFV